MCAIFFSVVTMIMLDNGYGSIYIYIIYIYIYHPRFVRIMRTRVVASGTYMRLYADSECIVTQTHSAVLHAFVDYIWRSSCCKFIRRCKDMTEVRHHILLATRVTCEKAHELFNHF